MTNENQCPSVSDQGTGELQRLVASWESEAGEVEDAAIDLETAGDGGKAQYEWGRAAEMRRCASMLAELCREPRPQSGEYGNERCVLDLPGDVYCNGNGRWQMEPCKHCQRTGSRKERSGPPITKHHP